MPQPGPEQQAQMLGSFHAAHGVAATIALGLFLIFGLHLLGFRFVVAAGVGR